MAYERHVRSPRQRLMHSIGISFSSFAKIARDSVSKKDTELLPDSCRKYVQSCVAPTLNLRCLSNGIHVKSWTVITSPWHNFKALQWRHNGLNGVSNHHPHHCLLSRLFGRRSKKTPKLRVTGLCAGNSPGTGEFPAQMASNTENVFIWWRRHDRCLLTTADSMAWKCDCIHREMYDVITSPCCSWIYRWLSARLWFLTYPAVPYDDLAVPDIFPSGTIGSPKNSITMMLIRHFDRCLHFHDQSRRFLRELWLCKVTARWPDLTHLSVHSLVNGVRSTRTSF